MQLVILRVRLFNMLCAYLCGWLSLGPARTLRLRLMQEKELAEELRALEFDNTATSSEGSRSRGPHESLGRRSVHCISDAPDK